MTARRTAFRLLLGAALVAGLAACGDDDETAPAAEAPPTTEAPAAPEPAHTLELTAEDFALQGPETVPAGVTEVTLVNHGAEDHQAAFFRFTGEETFEQVLAAVAERGLDAATEFGEFVAGPNGASPEGHSSATVDLRPGRYAVICFIPGLDGVPHVVKGMVKELVVDEGDPAPADEPTGLPVISLREFAIDVPEGFDGRGAFEVVNEGAVAHELVVTALPGDTTVDDIVAWMRPAFTAPEGPPPADDIAGTTMISPGGRAVIDLDLEPGRYALVCYLPADATSSHLGHGMGHEFTVD